MAKPTIRIEIAGDARKARRALADTEQALAGVEAAAKDTSGALEQVDRSAPGGRLAQGLGRARASVSGLAADVRDGLGRGAGEAVESLASRMRGSLGGAGDAVADQLDVLAGKFKGLGPAAVAGIGAAGAAAAGLALATKASVGQVLSLAEQTRRVQAVTGAGAEQASLFLQASERLGTSGDDVLDLLSEMGQNVAEDRAELEALGLTIRETADGTVDMLGTFEEAGRAIMGIEDPARRAQLASKLFGEEWRKAAGVLGGAANGELRRTTEQLGQMGAALDQGAVDSAAALSESFRELKDSAQALLLAVGEDNVQSLRTFVDAINDLASTVGVDNLGQLASSANKVLNPLSMAADALRRLRGEEDDAGDAAARAAQQRDAAASGYRTYRAAVADARAEVDELAAAELALIDAQDRAASAAANLESASRRVADAQARLVDVENAAAGLAGDVEDRRLALADAEARLADVESRRVETVDQVSGAVSRLESAQQRLLDVERDRVDVAEQLEDAEMAVVDAELARRRAAFAVADAEAAVAKLQRRFDRVSAVRPGSRAAAKVADELARAQLDLDSARASAAKAADQQGDAEERLAEAQEEARTGAGYARELAAAQRDVAAAADELAARQAEASASMSDGGQQARDLERAQRDVAAAARDLDDAQGRLDEALSGTGQHARDLERAQADLESAQRDEERAARDAAVANWELSQRTEGVAAGSETAGQRVAGMRDELVKLADAAAPGSPLRTNLEELIAQLDAVLAVQTAAEAALRSKFAERPGEDFFPVAGAPQLQRRAGGGPVKAGEPYLVGEEGPEIVMPRQAGTVLNASESRRALAAGSPLPAAARGGGVVTQHITLELPAGSPAEWVEAMQQELRWQAAQARRQLGGIGGGVA